MEEKMKKSLFIVVLLTVVLGMFSFTNSLNAQQLLYEDFHDSWEGVPPAPSGWIVIDADDDGTTWSQSAQYLTPLEGDYVAHGMGNQDDWLITPSLFL